MNLPVESLVEQSVNRQVNSLVGDKDTNLNTIVKMSLLPELETNEYQSILTKIKSNNQLEQYYIQKEYDLTYDSAGNLISVKDINNGKTTESQEKFTANSGSILSESK